MREIDAEEDKNDWVRAVVDVPGVGDGVVDRLAELNLPVMPYNGGKAPIDKERFVNARAEDYWTLRERFEQARSTSTRMTTSSPLSSARSSRASIPAGGSRSNRKTTCASAACRHRTELMPWRSASLAAQGSDDQGMVTGGPARWDTADSWPLSMNSDSRRSKRSEGRAGLYLRTTSLERQQIFSLLSGSGQPLRGELRTTSGKWFRSLAEQC